jgi:hypothetical protein
MLTKGNYLGVGSSVPLGGPILGPIMLDPGSLAFDYPDKYGYKLLYHNLEEYINGLSAPCWHQWINYETGLLNKEAITGLILESIGFTITERKEYGFFDNTQASAAYLRLKADIVAVNQVNRIMSLNVQEREEALKTLKINYDNFINPKG